MHRFGWLDMISVMSNRSAKPKAMEPVEMHLPETGRTKIVAPSAVKDYEARGFKKGAAPAPTDDTKKED